MAKETNGEAVIVHDILGLLDEMRAERGNNISVAEMKMLLGSLKDDENAGVLDAVQKIAECIRAGKIALSLNPHSVASDLVPDAGLELEAAVLETEKAANNIMDAAEDVANLAEQVEGELKDKLLDASTKIFEASNFQDVTGQRIRKVGKTLLDIESIVQELLTQLEDVLDITEIAKPKTVEEELLSGPQLSEEAPSQDDIDKLFDGA